MMLQDPTVKERNIDGNNILVSKNPCYKTEKNLRDFKFSIANTTVTLRPHGYVYESIGMSNRNNPECFIQITPLPDLSNHYRLGTTFLKNFYVAFDYENNYIGFAGNIGSNQELNTKSSGIEGVAKNPGMKFDTKSFVVVYIIVLIVLVIIALCIFFKCALNRRNANRGGVASEDEAKEDDKDAE